MKSDENQKLYVILRENTVEVTGKVYTDFDTAKKICDRSNKQQEENEKIYGHRFYLYNVYELKKV